MCNKSIFPTRNVVKQLMDQGGSMWVTGYYIRFTLHHGHVLEAFLFKLGRYRP